MYECWTCGKEFEEPTVDSDGDNVCPECGSVDISIIDVVNYDGDDDNDGYPVDEEV